VHKDVTAPESPRAEINKPVILATKHQNSTNKSTGKNNLFVPLVCLQGD